MISAPPENNNTSVIKSKSGSKKFRPKLLPKKIKTRIASRQQQDDKNSDQAVVPLGKLFIRKFCFIGTDFAFFFSFLIRRGSGGSQGGRGFVLEQQLRRGQGHLPTNVSGFFLMFNVKLLLLEYHGIS